MADELRKDELTVDFAAADIRGNPHPLRAGVGISFAGEVAYARMLHDELRERGIHVGHTAIGGRIDEVTPITAPTAHHLVRSGL